MRVPAFLRTSFFFSGLFAVSFSFGQHYFLLAGTYTDSLSKGIYVYDFNAKNGKLTWVSNTDSATNPSWLTVSDNGRYVYSVNETNGNHPGRVSAYSFNKENGQLQFINTVSSGGDDPCYVTTTRDNRWLTVANYSSGTMGIFPLNGDGSIHPYTILVHDTVFREAGDHAMPHVHETVFSPDEKFLLAPDLGLDKLIVYPFAASMQPPADEKNVRIVHSEKKSGPRHLVFHPNGKFVYLMHELNGMLTVYSYNEGVLQKIQEALTFKKGFEGRKDGAEVYISPDGKFLYASNRGDLNEIAVFSINPSSGLVNLKGIQSTGGRGPRGFIIDPSGRYLLVAHQYTGNIEVFKRNPHTGLLRRTRRHIFLPKPVCLRMIPRQ